MTARKRPTRRAPARGTSGKRRRRVPKNTRGLAILILACAVALAILVFAIMAVLDLYNPPSDSKLGHQAMAVGAGAVAGAMSLIGVYVGMGASGLRPEDDGDEEVDGDGGDSS